VKDRTYLGGRFNCRGKKKGEKGEVQAKRKGRTGGEGGENVSFHDTLKREGNWERNSGSPAPGSSKKGRIQGTTKGKKKREQRDEKKGKGRKETRTPERKGLKKTFRCREEKA